VCERIATAGEQMTRADHIPFNDSITKPSNPKDKIGVTKPPLSFVPLQVMMEVGAAMLEGGLKYGAHNWRVIGVRHSVYFDACIRHLCRWYEGEDIDPDSGVHHVTKAITSLCVLRDAMKQGKAEDDRPPKADPMWYDQISADVAEILSARPEDERKKPFTEKGLKDES
jgi:hypothetical protein